MTTKEKIILQSIEVIKSRISEIDRIIDFNPATELNKIHKEAIVLLEKYKTFEERTSRSYVAQFTKFTKREKEINEFAEKYKSTVELFDEKEKLKSELSDLRIELYWIEEGKKRLAK